MAILSAAIVVAAIASAGSVASGTRAATDPPPAGGVGGLAALGRDLFFDADLSFARTQSCATCHDPASGFADPRADGAGGAVSVGGDGRSLGTRNAPGIAYAAATPPFGRDAEGAFGGQFLDGRAADLESQAGGPLLNPVEMAMPDRASVVARLREKPATVAAFDALFAPGVLDDADAGFDAAVRALAAYERSADFATCDSKYDRSLRGEATLTDAEELGRVLFFSRQFTNCQLCHRLGTGGSEAEAFTNHRFHNIGVPANPALAGPVDHGLMDRPDSGPADDGKFRVPTLRNVAVTAPYMHNGVFEDLRTVVLFYNHYNSIAKRRQIDPETGEPWAAPEVPGTISTTELEAGPGLDDRRIDALVAFMKTLTDRRYEPLLDDH